MPNKWYRIVFSLVVMLLYSSQAMAIDQSSSVSISQERLKEVDEYRNTLKKELEDSKLSEKEKYSREIQLSKMERAKRFQEGLGSKKTDIILKNLGFSIITTGEVAGEFFVELSMVAADGIEYFKTGQVGTNSALGERWEQYKIIDANYQKFKDGKLSKEDVAYITSRGVAKEKAAEIRDSAEYGLALLKMKTSYANLYDLIINDDIESAEKRSKEYNRIEDEFNKYADSAEQAIEKHFKPIR